jgi:hypothetical protein
MNQLIESLWRLYKFNKIDNEKLCKLLENKKINAQEYEYIISAKNDT